MSALATADPYASHLPVLRMVLALVKPKRVLELGAGLYSTPEFLNCPSVEKVHSLETSGEWAIKVKQRVANDARLEIWKDYGIPQNYLDYDLVFIDNADNAEDREAAIRTVLSRPHPVTVIHDAENPLYAQAIEKFTEDYMTLGGEPPWTAVCW